MKRRKRVVAMLMLLTVAGCGPAVRAPVQEKRSPAETAAPVSRGGQPVTRGAASRAVAPETYKVRAGDTLHGIGWRFGIDFRDLVRWNRLADPDRIYVGQTLRLTPPRASATRPSPNTPSAAPKPAPAAAPRDVSGWRWPASGQVEAANSVLGSRGIRILGQRGQPVSAAAGGRVVYSGSGLRGYGQLIIIKHNERFLSAYAHNDRLFVPEGTSVAAGQKIAEMGDSDAKRVMLHFEIRRDGKPVDPLQYLPER